MKIKRSVYEELMCEVPAVPPEVGIILGGKGDVVECYHVDPGLPCGDGCYLPDTGDLNLVIEDWVEKGVSLIGFAHTHSSVPTLSSADKVYINEILGSLKLYFDALRFPVVIPGEHMVSYVATMEGNNLIIAEDNMDFLD